MFRKLQHELQSNCSETYRPLFTRLFDMKHLMAICKETYEDNAPLRTIVENVDWGTVFSQPIQDSKTNFENFLVHMLKQFSVHLHSGDEEAVQMALISQELLNDYDVLHSICCIIDSNEFISSIIKFMVNNRASGYSQRRLLIVPFR